MRLLLLLLLLAYSIGAATEPYSLELVKKAEEGDALSQNNLGCYLESGNGVKKDVANAFQWYFKAANSGYVEAQFNLCRCYAS